MNEQIDELVRMAIIAGKLQERNRILSELNLGILPPGTWQILRDIIVPPEK